MHTRCHGGAQSSLDGISMGDPRARSVRMNSIDRPHYSTMAINGARCCSLRFTHRRPTVLTTHSVDVHEQMDCIHLGPEALEPLRRMACLESLSLSGVAKLTDEALVQVCYPPHQTGRKFIAEERSFPIRRLGWQRTNNINRYYTLI